MKAENFTQGNAWRLLDNINEGVLVVAVDGKLHYANPAAHALLGLAPNATTFEDAARAALPHSRDVWRILCAPPAVAQVQINGRYLKLQSAPCAAHNQTLFQITVQPYPATEHDPSITSLAQLTALTQISNEPQFDRKLLHIVNGLKLTGWNRVALTLRDPEFHPTELLTAGFTPLEEQYLRENMLPAARWRALFADPTFQSFRRGSCYFVPGDSAWSQANFAAILPDDKATGDQPDAWHPNDLLCVVLKDRQQRKIGLMTLDQPVNGRRPGAQMLQTIELFAQFAASVIENAQLVDETLAHSRELELILDDVVERERFYSALGSVSLAINYSLDLEKVLNLICDESLRIFSVDGAFIWQEEAGRLVCRAAQGPGAERLVGMTLPQTSAAVFLAGILQTGEPVYINYVQDIAPLSALHLPQPTTVQALLGIPLKQDGRPVGVLVLADSRQPGRFSDKDVTRATMFGVQAAVAIRNAALFAELRRFNEALDLRVAERTAALREESARVKFLLRITSQLAASLDQDRVLKQALALVEEAVPATQSLILLVDHAADKLVLRAARSAPFLASGAESSAQAWPEQLAAWVMRENQAVIVPDARRDPRWSSLAQEDAARAALAVPLVTNAEIVGVLLLLHTEPDVFTRQQLDLVEAAAIQVANALNNASLYLLIRDQAQRLGRMLHLEQIESAKNQAILESIADGVVVADAHNRIVLVNLPASNILGMPRHSLIGKSINELLGLYSHAETSWLATIADWARNADRIKEWTFLAGQLNIEAKVVSIHLSPVLAGSQFFGTVSIFRDITKEVEVDRLKSEFVSNVSHELRTPMTSIKGYVDLLLLGAAEPLGPRQQRYLEVVKNNAQRLQILVNDLLNISRLEMGEIKLDLRPLSLQLLIRQVVDGHLNGRIQHEHKQLSVSTNLPESLPAVYADAQRVVQILTNLLDNAFNYTLPGGHIGVSAAVKNDFVFIRISDTGIGIAPANQAHIFERFYRADDNLVRSIPGTGLGLTIVKSLVEMHGGALQVESKPGKGSAFTFALPVAGEMATAGGTRG
jgi:PAS domain S-box-containing protein